MLYDKLITSHLSCPRPILTDCREEWTYRDLDRRCGQIAASLRKRGVEKGDRVFIIAEHSVRAVCVILACIRQGVCAVPLPAHISTADIEFLIADSAPRAVIGTNEALSVPTLSFEQLLTESGEDCPPVCTTPSSLAYILYTSGSTGRPKGVMAPERQTAFCIDTINRRLGNSPEERILCCLPLSFDYGLYQLFLSLDAEARLILPPDGPLQKIVTWLLTEQVTGFPAMPAMLNMLLKSRLLERVSLPSLRYITSTGDVFPVQLIRRLHELLPGADIIPMYGLTECKRVAILPRGRMDKALAGSCGLPLDGVSVRILDPNVQGVGELAVFGNNVMAGYWGDPEATTQVFFHDPIYGNSLLTGDLFQMDSDGFLYFRGRKKRILKVNGYRISALEIEERILAEMGGMLEELRVLGKPDAIRGEQIAVCVSSRLPGEEIRKRLREIAAVWSAYQRPHCLCCLRDPLPKSENGKIDDAALQKELSGHACVPLF